MKTREEIERLKRDWHGDSCWDIETTEGFEDHKQELLEYRKKCEAKWDEEYRKEQRKGGHAFPCYTGNDTAEIGMTKRDYFAGQAIAGLLANTDYAPLTMEQGEGRAIGFARLSFMVADALVKVGNE